MKTNPKKTPRRSGFALIVTLSLMILLTVVAVGLLSLSSISLRSTSQGAAMATARSNARLAMMLALGELQVSMGRDQSADAPASAVFASAQRPRLLGAWQQKTAAPTDWHWTPVTNSSSPSYSAKANAFSRWLISTPTPADAQTFGFGSGSDPKGSDAVTLVGDTTKSLSDSEGTPTTVVAAKVKVGTAAQPGKFGWAVFDESTKASIDLGDPATTQNVGLEVASRTVPSRFRADILEKEKLATLKTPEKLVSLETASVPATAANRPEFRKRFHDFTTGSAGLLTDTANGGLKTDLTSLFEPATLPSGAFATSGPYPADFAANNGAPNWAYLRDHYRKYKNITNPSTGMSYRVDAASGKDLSVIGTGATTGLIASPNTERLVPVIAKLQLVFSMVAHYSFDVAQRRKNLDDKGNPKGYTNYGAVDLVYDPVITLYNPYDVTLDLSKTRIRIWDPPVAFSFTKYDHGWPYKTNPISSGNVRSDGQFVGLAQMHSNAKPTDRKRFTLVLADGTSQGLGARLKLLPGEVKVFSPRVESSWTWGTETAGGYGSNSQATFFDWDTTKNFGNQDHRQNARYPTLGVECAPGFDTLAGLQTDNIANNRNPATRYSFEVSFNEVVTVRTTDEIQVDAKPLVVATGAPAQFQVDLLAGVSAGSASNDTTIDSTNSAVAGDTLRSYRFFFSNIADEISDHPTTPITRKFEVGKILQPDTDRKAQFGKKRPFAMLEMTARTTKEQFTDSKPWLYNNFIVDGGEQRTANVGLSHQSYDLRLKEITSFDNFPDGIAIDPDTKNGYFGPNGSVGEGSSFVPMLHVPVAPTASLGDLIPANLASGSQLPRVVHPFGNSRAHPLISAKQVTQGTMMDHSYLLNDALWDSYYFSTLTGYGTNALPPIGGVMTDSPTFKDVLNGVFEGTTPALNNRIIPIAEGEPKVLADTVAGLTDFDRSRQIAKYVAVEGPFNVNSTSVDAWRAVLSSLRDRPINGLEVKGSGIGPTAKVALANKTDPAGDKTPLVRVGKPLIAGSSPFNIALRWAGYRSLDDGQITELAKKIVDQIKLRGVADSAPFFSLGEFVNRRLDDPSALHSLAGVLQTAINDSKINDDVVGPNNTNSKTISEVAIAGIRKQGVKTPKVMSGETAEGSPVMVTQGDLMAALAPIATVRGDTFKIRSYGEATASNGTTVVARAWCETIVQRTPDFVDPVDAPQTALASLNSSANKTFGRRFKIVSFRWLDESEL
ncbi:MAG: hypothetical protein ABI162_12205 [Luteolibacter sp.]